MHAPSNAAPQEKGPLYKALYFQVIVGVILGITVGHFWPDFGASLKVLGDGFVKLVKMMIGPIVFCTIVSGITSLSDSKEIGKTLLKAMGLFYVLTIIALVTGLVTVLVMQPGAGFNIDPAHLDPTVAAGYAKQAAPKGFVEFVLHIIPNAFFGAFAEGGASAPVYGAAHGRNALGVVERIGHFRWRLTLVPADGSAQLTVYDLTPVPVEGQLPETE